MYVRELSFIRAWEGVGKITWCVFKISPNPAPSMVSKNVIHVYKPNPVTVGFNELVEKRPKSTLYQGLVNNYFGLKLNRLLRCTTQHISITALKCPLAGYNEVFIDRKRTVFYNGI